MIRLDYRHRLKENKKNDDKLLNKLNIHERIVWFIIQALFWLAVIIIATGLGWVVSNTFCDIFGFDKRNVWALSSGPIIGALGIYFVINGLTALIKLGILTDDK